jgi:DTW domain-containing protein
MTDSATTRRAACATCLRAASACICRWITPVATDVELLILQHPLEVANAKNSARLLHLCLPSSKMVTGETFDPAELAALLGDGGRTPLLLYPDTPPGGPLAVPPPPALDASMLRSPQQVRLVVLDGTWRKSRKMLFLNPLLQQLPRIALSGMPASHYRIRKAHAPDQLSTLEAATYALMQVEGTSTHLQPLLDAFDGFVAQQDAYRTHLKSI